MAVKMEGQGTEYAASIPGQLDGRMVRYRIRATGESGAVRHFPAENEIRPAHSVYISEPVKSGAIPVAHFFNVGEKEFERGAAYRTELSRPQPRETGGFGRPGVRGNRESPEERARREAEQRLSEDALSAAWEALTLKDSQPAEKLGVLLPAFRGAQKSLSELREEWRSAEDVEKAAERIDEQVSLLKETLITECAKALNAEQLDPLKKIGDSEAEGGRRRGRGFDPGLLMRRFLNLEKSWFQVSMNGDVTQAQLAEARRVAVAAIEKRDSTTIETNDEGFPDFETITQTVQSQQEGFLKELEATLGEELFGKLGLDNRSAFNFGPGRPGGQTPQHPLRPQGSSALVYTDPKTGKTKLFDFINIVPRKSGYKVRLHKDRTLDGMSTINVIFESDEATCINEALAFDLYRAAGSAGQRAGFLRLAIDGKLVGYHLWFEQANGAFFRQNKIDDNGNLYKVTWQGGHSVSEFTPEDKLPKRRQDIVRRYEKKSNLHDGYDDLIELVEALEQSEGDGEKMWQVIEERFDVENAINYFAVNSLLSHWDGFFNNYFLYHDAKRDKWMLFPFDQDSTWSQRMGDVESLSTMPLNYGSEEAVRGGGGFGRGGNGWWRDGGEISKPLLANSEFKKRFQSRLHELAQTVFNEEDFGQRIGNVESMLKDEVALRAAERGSDSDAAQEELAR
ncbi:MAG: CotH kinase family protein, partial [Verrucomicrobia bacterium]|nr:CotH kinase family protein [Verrucomicrobiota bacterium]